MNIYVVSRTDRIGWDEYDSIVVACKSEEEAREFEPGGACWPKEFLTVELIGKTIKGVEPGIILASFHAG